MRRRRRLAPVLFGSNSSALGRCDAATGEGGRGWEGLADSADMQRRRRASEAPPSLPQSPLGRRGGKVKWSSPPSDAPPPPHPPSSSRDEAAAAGTLSPFKKRSYSAIYCLLRQYEARTFQRRSRESDETRHARLRYILHKKTI